jgi:hypothetical protein
MNWPKSSKKEKAISGTPSLSYKPDNSDQQCHNGNEACDCSQYTARHLKRFARIRDQRGDETDHAYPKRNQQPHPPLKVARTKGHEVLLCFLLAAECITGLQLLLCNLFRSGGPFRVPGRFEFTLPADQQQARHPSLGKSPRRTSPRFEGYVLASQCCQI